ncbi:LytR/AlgR family response regulator transcription factor [Aquimarina sp. 2201CG14-23]|uniref:LytR/AlgR family response regulator transcription factor n=1 Tax=Aquimarina mycalae TaxID=3040073 RepID=UPI002477D9A3|nr:LytTR family DNA-binding domain-containing protein [Aquimarina sp. 2201CG14-23]MDH7447949.1 LytTR family DNA-binding domain-containing protein [Aquimarina sp. 2201CG14-23]
MLKAIIIDDEQLAINTLKWEIETNCKEVDVVFSSNNPVEAIQAINEVKPDVLFLDIEMPELDGFQLLNQLEFKSFDLIFTTAYDNYAIKAFKLNAIDYLLKPIEKQELVQAVNKVVVNKQNETLGDNLKSYIKHNLELLDTNNAKIALPMEKKIVLVDQKEILYCESDGSYTQVFLDSGIKHVISKNLKQLSHQLDDNYFIRIHQSFIVNINSIKEYYRGDGGEVILLNGKNIPVSRSKKNELLKHILK